MICLKYVRNFKNLTHSKIYRVRVNFGGRHCSQQTNKNRNTPRIQQVKSNLRKFTEIFYTNTKLLVPVHAICTLMWFGLFYEICESSNVDIIAFLKIFDLESTMLNYFKNSSLGGLTITLFLLRLTKPFRYAFSVVLTFFISHVCRKHGIVPLPEIKFVSSLFQSWQDIKTKVRTSVHQPENTEKQSTLDRSETNEPEQGKSKETSKSEKQGKAETTVKNEMTKDPNTGSTIEKVTAAKTTQVMSKTSETDKVPDKEKK